MSRLLVVVVVILVVLLGALFFLAGRNTTRPLAPVEKGVILENIAR